MQNTLSCSMGHELSSSISTHLNVKHLQGSLRTLQPQVQILFFGSSSCASGSQRASLRCLLAHNCVRRHSRETELLHLQDVLRA